MLWISVCQSVHENTFEYDFFDIFFCLKIIAVFYPKSSENAEKLEKSGTDKGSVLTENLMETAGICRNSATKSA